MYSHFVSYLGFVQQKKTKFIMEQPYMVPIRYWQYHGCWFPGDFRSQGIGRLGIDPQSRNITSPVSKELITTSSGMSDDEKYPHYFWLWKVSTFHYNHDKINYQLLWWNICSHWSHVCHIYMLPIFCEISHQDNWKNDYKLEVCILCLTVCQWWLRY